MRISVPTIPYAPSTSVAPRISHAAAVERIAEFLAPGNVTLLSGAGVSVDSGIRAYRGKDGRYMNPNYKPIFYHELVDETPKGYAFRQRYWLRSYLGYPPVRDALPNTTHYALAALQYTSHIRRVVTQNVDGLHSKALSSILPPAPPMRREEEHLSRILELHGTLHKVSCKHGHVVDRNTFQTWLAHSNPRWARFMEDLERTGRKLRTNPDGDVELPGASYDDFIEPDCPACLRENRKVNMKHKPHLIFFGESISKEVKEESFRAVEESDRLFIVGTTLATYSAFRLLKRALELHKPVLMLNVGPTRADSFTFTTSTEAPRGVGAVAVEKIELPSGSVLREIVKRVTGFRHLEDPILAKFLTSGIVQPPTDPGERKRGESGESEDRGQDADEGDDNMKATTRPPQTATVAV